MKIVIVRIYFLGIGGTAMGNAALMFKSLGHTVIGSDESLYPPMSEILEEGNLDYYEGYDPQRLAKIAPDLVIVGNAISRGNPEVEWLLTNQSITMMSLPQLLSEFILKERTPIVITGTHGKTTTASILAYLLKENDLSPSWFIGGSPKSLPGGAFIGDGSTFVIEGDEYDSAFFDKRSKFIHYRPFIVAVNNLEMDHADIFRDITDIQRSFSHLFKIIPSNGFLVINGDDPNINALLDISWCQVFKVGIGEANDLRIHSFKEDENGASFNLIYRGTLWGTVSWGLNGLYNARNAAIAALSAALSEDPEHVIDFKLKALDGFKGVKRRQEQLYKTKDLVVIEDFAHHPSAIEHILRSIRTIYKGYEIIACFEPRSNTARSNLFQKSFAESFKYADALMLGRLHRANLLAVEARLNCEVLCTELLTTGVKARSFICNDQLLIELEALLDQNFSQRKKSLVIFFTNGSFGGILPRLVSALEGK